ncbi:MAG: PD40 domain-containing protein [Planctomycetes bacterium]|nr:PD40 domain-containing protein [Planctomycetota bacterium]
MRSLTRLPEGGAVQGPEVSPDGKRILVGLRPRAGEPFHVCEVVVESGEVRQLTSGAANDVDPCYLPDGRIAFSSDRDGTLEYYHQERTRALYVARADGSEPRQVTFNPNQDYEPLPLRDGSLLYSSYRFYGQDGSGGVFSEGPGSIARIETQLRAVLPSGFHDRHVYGAGRGGFYVPVRALPDGDQFQAPSLLHGHDHLGVSVSQARELDDGRLVCIAPAGLTVVDPRLDPRDCEVPVFPEVVNLAGGEEVYIHDHDDMNPVGRTTSPRPVGGSLVLVSHAPWHRLGGAAYGIYLLDLETGARTLVYDDPALSDVDPVPIVPRPQDPPRLLPRGAEGEREDRAVGTGTIAILSVFDSDLAFDRSRVRYLQVLASEQIGTSMNANGGFRTRVLATVPVAADGSVLVEVPADTPIHFNLLDAEEGVVVHETEFLYVRPGERRACAGCHEPRGRAPRAGRALPAALARPPYRALPTRGDLIYMGQPGRSYSVIHR